MTNQTRWRIAGTVVIALALFAVGWRSGRRYECNHGCVYPYTMMHKPEGKPCPPHYQETYYLFSSDDKPIAGCILIPPEKILDYVRPNEQFMPDSGRRRQ
jgi:hypothetical protein